MKRCFSLKGLAALGLLAVLGLVSGLRTPAAEPGAAPDRAKPATLREWPLFGGTPQHNLVNTLDKNVPTEWSVKQGVRKNIKWVAQLGSVAYGGPVIAGGKIYVSTNNNEPRNPKVKGDKGILMCFRESDGQFLWQAVHDKLPTGAENDFPQVGIASTPAVEGNRLYYVSNRAELICADTEGFLNGNDGVQDEQYKDKTDADIIWRLDMIKELKVYPYMASSSSPLVAGDLVFVLTGNGVGEEKAGGQQKVVAPEAPSFIAVNKKTGKVAWQDNSPGDGILEGQWSNPAYAEVNGQGQVIFPGGDGWLRGFEAKTGKPLWKFDCNPKDAEFKLGGRGNRSYLVATPVVYDNKVFIGTGDQPDNGPGVGHLWCVDITKTGDLSPEVVVAPGKPPKTMPNKNSGVVWHYGGLAPKGGDRDFIFGRTMSSCAIHDGLLYIAELDGYLHCLDAKTGTKYWDHDMKAGVWGSPSWVDGKVYLGNEDGDVTIFSHGKAKKLLGKVEMERGVKSTPIVVNGVLYVMTDTQLFAIATK